MTMNNAGLARMVTQWVITHCTQEHDPIAMVKNGIIHYALKGVIAINPDNILNDCCHDLANYHARKWV